MPKTNGAANETSAPKTTTAKKKSDSRAAETRAASGTSETRSASMGQSSTEQPSANPSAHATSTSHSATDALAKRPESTGPKRSGNTSGKDASAKEQLRSLADMGRERVASEARGVVSTLEGVAEAFDQGDQAWVGRYVTTASDKLGDLARTLDEADTDELVEETRRYARREPWLFLGGCFVLGLAAGRVLRAGVSSEGPR